ncbi:hypothetical protein Tco_0648662 [Tanacetum coccineum]
MTRYETSTVSGDQAGIASGIGADSAFQYVVPHVPPLLRSFPILFVKHHEQQDVKLLTNSSLNDPSTSRKLFLIGSGWATSVGAGACGSASGAAPVLESAGFE